VGNPLTISEQVLTVIRSKPRNPLPLIPPFLVPVLYYPYYSGHSTQWTQL